MPLAGSKTLELDLPRDGPRTWFVSYEFLLPRKVVMRCLEAIDYVDSPDHPAMLHESTLKAMVVRFDSVFSNAEGREEARDHQLCSVIEHLRRHTKRRRGEIVVSTGYVEWEDTSKVYDLFALRLNVFERIYFTLDIAAYPAHQENIPWLARICSSFLVIMIILSIMLWALSTLPYEPIRAIPEGCVSTEMGECAPEPAAIFRVTEAFCAFVFTLEYCLKLLTVHSVRFAMGDEELLERVLGGGAVETLQAARLLSMETPSVSWFETMGERINQNSAEKLNGRCCTFAKRLFSFESIVDVFSIAPFWMEFISGGSGTGGAIILMRILRLTRIFRVFKLGKYNEVFNLFSNVMSQSSPALSLLMVFVLLDCCLFGALMWFAEQGAWYPEGHAKLAELEIEGRGAYLRQYMGSSTLQETPFDSIPHAFWFVIVTITTVGYGDVFPTTWLGKLLASVTVLNGLILLAMPIGIIGANFSTEYFKVHAEKRQRERQKRQVALRRQIEQEQDRAICKLNSENGYQVGTELQRLYRARHGILEAAKDLDTSWRELLPELRHTPLSARLRHVVEVLLDLSEEEFWLEKKGKPVVQMSRLAELDALTAEVLASVSASVVVGQGLASGVFGLREARSLRQSWFEFTYDCWEYVVDLCRVQQEDDPPEWFRLKAHLVRKSCKVGRASATRRTALAGLDKPEEQLSASGGGGPRSAATCSGTDVGEQQAEVPGAAPDRPRW